jgi:hypothetical protein
VVISVVTSGGRARLKASADHWARLIVNTASGNDITGAVLFVGRKEGTPKALSLRAGTCDLSDYVQGECIMAGYATAAFRTLAGRHLS